MQVFRLIKNPIINSLWITWWRLKFWSSNFILMLLFFFCFCFLAIFAQSFPDARLSPLIISGPVVLTKSIIFSGNSILFLDFSYLLSIFFFLMMLLLALLLLLFFPTAIQKQQFRLLCPIFPMKFAVLKSYHSQRTGLKQLRWSVFGGPSHQENPLTS